MREIENPFAVLGVDIDASVDEINNAWKEKVKKLHPDRYPDAPEEIVSKLNEETSRVNVAYQLLKEDLEKMRAMFSAPSSESQSQGQQRSSSTGNSTRSQPKVPRDACEVCASLNTETFEFTRQTGFVFARNVGSMSARLCKGCATAIGRTYQSRTLTTGWWGVLSAPTNLFYVIKNAQQLFRASKLPDPVAPPGFRTTPLPGGKPIFYRPVSWIGIIVIGLIIFAAASEDQGTGSGNNSPPTVGLPRAEWQVGNCVSGYSTVFPVSCTESNTGRIVSVGASELSCQGIADSYVFRDGVYYCISTL
jgi:hypothetical protein